MLMDVEVTDDDFHRTTGLAYHSKQPPRNLSARLNNLFHKHKSSAASVHSDRATADRRDVDSVVGTSTVGDSSATGNVTIASGDTVKWSNRKVVKNQPPPPPPEQRRQVDSKKNPWHKIKKMIGAKKEEDMEYYDPSSPYSSSSRSRSLSTPVVRFDNSIPIRKRVESDHTRKRADSRDNDLDDAIRGRFDGMDVLSLGTARLASAPRKPDSLTRNSRLLHARDMVQDMLRTSAGREPPELVLEGFIVSDRWMVRMDNLHGDLLPQLQSTDDESSADGSPTLPTTKLLASIWGRNGTPPPSHAPPLEDDDVFQMAASCSVPIDIDEETFIIDTPTHLQAVHDIASIPLKAGRFDDAINIFQKILKGLEMRHGDEPHHLIGSTLHNIGVLQLWQGHYQEAWENLNQAASVRIHSLSTDHPDIAVSLGREAIALFALEKWTDAVYCLEKALRICVVENATRAKLLNNLGVVYYQQRKHVEAMTAFTSALEIQRIWLDGKVRRNSIVFDASITMGNMGKLYLEQENYQLSFFVNEEALLLQTTAFPKDHDIVLRSLDSIAYARAREGDYEKALQLYRGILRSQQSRFGPASKEAMETTKLIGILHTKTGNYDDALLCFTTLLKWQQAHLRESDPDLLRTRECIKMIESNLGGAVSVWI